MQSTPQVHKALEEVEVAVRTFQRVSIVHSARLHPPEEGLGKIRQQDTV